MSSLGITNYQPLVEVIDMNGEKYYTQASYEQMMEMRKNQELIDFSFSKECVKTSMIRKHRIADPEDVMIAWIRRNLTSSQKKMLDASNNEFSAFWKGSRTPTESDILHWVELAKLGKVAQFWR